MTEFTNPIFTAQAIAGRVKRLAKEISLAESEQPVELVGLMNGALVFLADLIRHLDFNFPLHLVRVQSYQGDRQGEVKVTLDFDPQGKRLLLVDDILDSGNSLIALMGELNRQGAEGLKTCCLLDKAKSPLKADYVGFHCPDLWVVGYGMDYRGLYRNLPFIAELPPSLR